MITLSCGHRVDSFDEGHDVALKRYTREWEKAVSYGVVCAECLKMYEKAGEVLHTDDEIDEWLTTQ